MQPLSVQFADSCSHSPCIFIIWKFFQNLLTNGNGIDQTSKLEGINTSAYLKSFWSGSNSSWTAEAFLLPDVVQGTPTQWQRRKDEHSHCHLRKYFARKCTSYELQIASYDLENLWELETSSSEESVN